MRPNSEMICFKRDKSCFNLRSACLCLRDEEILLFYFDKGDFWTLPGGRCNMHENTQDAATREFKEELEEDVTIKRLLWVIENFFIFNDEALHELLFIYLVELPKESEIINLDEFYAHEGERNMKCKWVNIKDLKNFNIKPNILSQILHDIPQGTKHIIHHDS